MGFGFTIFATAFWGAFSIDTRGSMTVRREGAETGVLDHTMGGTWFHQA